VCFYCVQNKKPFSNQKSKIYKLQIDCSIEQDRRSSSFVSFKLTVSRVHLVCSRNFFGLFVIGNDRSKKKGIEMREK